MRRRIARSLVALLVFAALSNAALASSSPYPSGVTGNDIGYPQCGTTPVGSGPFTVVGVGGGRAFSDNACLGDQFAWATLNNSAAAPVTLYMNINAPVGSSASNGRSGPMGSCSPRPSVCLSYNYGWNAAQHAYAYAQQQGAASSTWWLDVETANSWQTNTTYNAAVLDGAVAFFTSVGTVAGYYSNAAMWRKIVGAAAPPVQPVWYASAVTSAAEAATLCGTGSFDGGPVWLVQYSGGQSIDTDYGC